MFSADGQELHSLADLARDQLVFVSCVEAWSDPKLSHSEQQRRAILTNLASDIAHIRRFCALRDPQGSDPTEILTSRAPRKDPFLTCGYLDFESAVTAQNDEFKGSFHSSFAFSFTSRLSQETPYLASILDRFVKRIGRNRSCAQKERSLRSR